jgi:hypothetical protein
MAAHPLREAFPHTHSRIGYKDGHTQGPQRFTSPAEPPAHFFSIVSANFQGGGEASTHFLSIETQKKKHKKRRFHTLLSIGLFLTKCWGSA